MGKEYINFWYIQAEFLHPFYLSRIMCKEANKKKSIMSIRLVICGYHGKGEFRASININANFTSGRYLTRIFSLVHVQCKKYNGENLGNTAVVPIWDRLKNIYAG